MHYDQSVSFGWADNLEIMVRPGQIKNTYTSRPGHCEECRSILWVADPRQINIIGTVLK